MAIDWADPRARREHLRAWSLKEKLSREHPSWALARKESAAAAEEGERHKRFEEAVRAAATGTLSDEQRRHVTEFFGSNIKEEMANA
jgi:hypothetical protein